MEQSRGQHTAIHEADVFGTEKDRINCPFYWKIGACRHGEKCSRNHNKPPFSQTILIPHMYPNPAAPMFDPQGNPIEYEKQFLKEHLDNFYEDIFDELEKYGHIKDLMVCDNLCEHLLGNVYVKYSTEDEAAVALEKLNDRFYAGRILKPEFSPVTDFEEAKCKDWDTAECTRGGICNFMHLKVPSRTLTRELFGYDKFKTVRPSTRSGRSGGSRDEDRYSRNEGSRRRSSGHYDYAYDYDGDDRRRERRRRSGDRRSSRSYDHSDRSSRSYRRSSPSPRDHYHSNSRSRSYRSSREMGYEDPYGRDPHQQHGQPLPPQYPDDPYYRSDDRYYTYDHPPPALPAPNPHEDPSYSRYKRSSDEFNGGGRQDPYEQYVASDNHNEERHKKPRIEGEYLAGEGTQVGNIDGNTAPAPAAPLPPAPSHNDEQEQQQQQQQQQLQQQQ